MSDDGDGSEPSGGEGDMFGGDFFSGGGEGHVDSEGEFGSGKSDGSDGEGGGGTGCFFCCIGLILVLLVPYGIWENERTFVQTLRELERVASIYKQPCGSYDTNFDIMGSCSSCDLSDVRSGDVVFMACTLDNLKDLNAFNANFQPAELRPLLRSVEPAAKFQWSVEMFQYIFNTTSVNYNFQTGNVPDDHGHICHAGAGLSQSNDPGATMRMRRCCSENPRTEGFNLFYRENVGDANRCQERAGSRRLDAEVDEEKEEAAEERALQDDAREEFLENADAAGEELHEEGEEEIDADEVPARFLSSRSRNSSPRRRRSTEFHCTFTCRSWDSRYDSVERPDPSTWSAVPATKYRAVDYLEHPPANNVQRLPLQGSGTNVQAGQDGVSVGGINLARFQPRTPNDQLFEDMTSAPIQPFLAGSETLERSSAGEAQNGPLTVRKFRRNQQWTTGTSEPGSESHCIYSRNGAGGPANPLAGDLKVCFEAAALTKLSIMAEVQMIGNVPSFIVSKENLQTRVSDGYLLSKNTIASPEDLIEEAESQNDLIMKVLRIGLPLLMWLGIYCIFCPLLMAIEFVGDMLGEIPFIGCILEEAVEFLETLADIMLCCCSCMTGISISLFVMAVAWLFYRPLIGGLLLVGGLLLFCCVGALYRRQKGQPKVRHGKKKRKEAPAESATDPLNG